jgi:hypothetical protein
VRIVHLDAIEPTRIGATLWKPIRSLLGIRAFGINAYAAERPGETLFDEHDEFEGGAGAQRHEEVYIVLSGRATFTGGDGEVDAPTGTIVFCEDPGERRGARAEEAGTTVIAIGGPVGEPYEVAPWEFWFRVRRARALGDAREARTILEEGLARYPDDPTLLRLATES